MGGRRGPPLPICTGRPPRLPYRNMENLIREIHPVCGGVIKGYVCPKCPGNLTMTDAAEFKRHTELQQIVRLDQEVKWCDKCRRNKPLRQFQAGGRIIGTCALCRGGGINREHGKRQGVVEKYEEIHNRVKGMP